MSILAAILPIGVAAKVASSLFSRRAARDPSVDFSQVLQESFGARMIAQYDTDADGKISAAEFAGDDDSFARWDLNADGTVSSSEIDTALSAAEQWRLRDSNADGALTRGESGLAHGAFAAMDADGDYKVSQREFLRAYGQEPRA